MRRFIEGSVETITWLLFAIATFLLARQTYFAVQGQQPDYGTQQSALIVAGIVTATWLTMLGRIVLQIDHTPVDWILSASLMLAGVAVDIAVALSVVFEWAFPSHIALLVIVAHVVAHVIQWAVSAGQGAWKRFSADYESQEDRTRRLERELAIAERTLSNRTADAERRQYKGTCKGCKQEFESATSRGITNALNAHQRHCPGPPVESQNGHKKDLAEA
jgi:hypothetical protein